MGCVYAVASSVTESLFCFDKFVVDQNDERLIGPDGPVHLGNKAFRVLGALIAQEGRLLTKDALFDDVWDGTTVGEAALTSVIKELRRALGDDPKQPRFIESVYGRGYRFIGIPTALPYSSGNAHNEPVRSQPAVFVAPTGILPSSGTLIGRTDEIATLDALLTAERVVSIVGAGGVGKTTTAIEIGRGRRTVYDDGVWFVELASVATADRVAEAVAKAMQIALPSGSNALSTLIERLRSRSCLLILDNCEHVLGAVADLVEAIEAQATGITFLTTSQEQLGIGAERVFRLSPFTDDLAAMLFITRAKAADMAFEPSDAEQDIIKQICQQLGGMPLAIEMAAARAPTLGCANILERLDDRFRVLGEGRRTAQPRHRTLSAALDWSFGLLNPRDATIFRRISVFVGSFSLDAAVATCVDAEVSAADVVDAIASLVAKSLLTIKSISGSTRYMLLETTRAYATIKLTEAGERNAIERQRAEWCTQFCGPIWSDFNARTSDADLLKRYAVDFDNIYAAIDWALSAEGNAELGLAIIAASSTLWDDRTLRRNLDIALPRVSATTPPLVHAKLLVSRSHVTMRFDPERSLTIVDDAIEAIRASSNDPVVHCDALLSKGAALWLTGRYAEARQVADEVIATTEGLPDSRLKAFALSLDGSLAAIEGDHERSAKRFDQAIGSLRLFGANGLANFWRSLSLRLLPGTDLDARIDRWRILLARIKPGEMYADAVTVAVATEFARKLGERGTPEDLVEAVSVARQFFKTGALAVQYHFILVMASISIKAGRTRDAAILLGYADARAQAIGDAPDPEFAELRTVLASKIEHEMLASYCEIGGTLGVNAVIRHTLGTAEHDDLPEAAKQL